MIVHEQIDWTDEKGCFLDKAIDLMNKCLGYYLLEGLEKFVQITREGLEGHCTDRGTDSDQSDDSAEALEERSEDDEEEEQRLCEPVPGKLFLRTFILKAWLCLSFWLRCSCHAIPYSLP